eukprot:366069-Chlamydomonas_euryale.AAC.7
MDLPTGRATPGQNQAQTVKRGQFAKFYPRSKPCLCSLVWHASITLVMDAADHLDPCTTNAMWHALHARLCRPCAAAAIALPPGSGLIEFLPQCLTCIPDSVHAAALHGRRNAAGRPTLLGCGPLFLARIGKLPFHRLQFRVANCHSIGCCSDGQTAVP